MRNVHVSALDAVLLPVFVGRVDFNQAVSRLSGVLGDRVKAMGVLGGGWGGGGGYPRTADSDDRSLSSEQAVGAPCFVQMCLFPGVLVHILKAFCRDP